MLRASRTVACRAVPQIVPCRVVPRAGPRTLLQLRCASGESSARVQPPPPPEIPPPPPSSGPNYLHLTLLALFFGGFAYIATKEKTDDDDLFSMPPDFMKNMEPSPIAEAAAAERDEGKKQ